MTTQALLIQSLQRELIRVLSQDMTLSGLISGVYDHVAQGTALPYIRVSIPSATNQSTHGILLVEASVMVDIWSEYRGMSQLLLIAERVEVLLVKADITPAQTHLVSWNAQGQSYNVLKDGITRSAVLRYDAWLQPVS